MPESFSVRQHCRLVALRRKRAAPTIEGVLRKCSILRDVTTVSVIDCTAKATEVGILSRIILEEAATTVKENVAPDVGDCSSKRLRELT